MNDTKKRIVVAHPGRQHSHQLALALSDRNSLLRYFTGVPSHISAVPSWSRRLLKGQLSIYSLDIDPSLLRHCFASPIFRRLAAKVFPRAQAVDWAHRGDGAFDQIVASCIKSLQADLVVCYENAALKTFRIAKAKGFITVLDAASFHHTWQDQHHEYVESERAHARITRRKDAEIELADYVLTVSELARESYLNAGVDPQKVFCVPMGVDSSQFCQRVPDLSGEIVNFAFVGHIGKRKGADTLLDACQILAARNVAFCLNLFGRYDSDRIFDNMENCHARGWLPHSELSNALGINDVLVLPSRHDSFGMVVAESMACGMPVIVSENVGAKEMVVPGESGFVVPVDSPNELADAMQYFVDHRTDLVAMGNAARKTAVEYDWRNYRLRVAHLLEELVDRRSQTSMLRSESYV